MAKNLTNVHSKLDKILDRLGKLDTQQMTDRRRTDAQLRLITQAVGQMSLLTSEIALMSRDTSQAVRDVAASLAEVSQNTRDIGMLAAEALRASRESAERTALILAEMRKH